MRKFSEKIIIVGAPRSGTNMLRNVLSVLPGFATWPCDEINYIWRHGNLRYPSDEFTPDMATENVTEYVNGCFDFVASRYNATHVLEKTCANSLRIGFVNKIVPDARYIFIRRNGYDAVASAMHRWKAKLDLKYLLRKARFVPLIDLPYYATRYSLNRIYRLLSGSQRLAFWGPQLNGMDELLSNYSLEEVCALQWMRCVESASTALSHMSTDKWIEVAYEDFVLQPGKEFERIADWLGCDRTNTVVDMALSNVNSFSVGKGRRQLGDDVVTRLFPLIKDTQSKYGYD